MIENGWTDVLGIVAIYLFGEDNLEMVNSDKLEIIFSMNYLDMMMCVGLVSLKYMSI